MFLKGERCYTTKCAIERRNSPPGQHGERRSKASEYGLRLREKQKLKRLYGILERQLRRYFSAASRKKGITGEYLFKLLETRLDHVVSRMGFAANHNMARQFINHGHFLVNEKPVSIPSYQMKQGDVITVKAGSREIPQIKEAIEQAKKRGVPNWCEVNFEQFQGTLKSIPSREDINAPVQEQLIVEFYSK